MKLVKSLITACAVLLLCCPRSRAAATKTPDTTNNPDGNFDKQLDYRLRWNLDTLVGDYERNGRRDPKWDEYAKAGLSYFARVRSLAGSSKMKEPLANIPSAIKKAETNGCDDPMVLYLYARYVAPSEKLASKERGEMFRQVAEDLCRSRYAPIRKFYASLRAAEALNPGTTNTPAEVHHWRRQASQYLGEAVKDEAMPPGEVYEACEQLLQAVKANEKQSAEFYLALDSIIFKNWPSESSLYLLKGTFYTDYAWQGRGTATADKVTEKGWELFEDRLAEAEKALARGWKLNPLDKRIACKMITVELGQGKGRDRMETWFKRATDLDPDYYDAFYAKLYYLEPKWYGSPEDMLEFGRECVNSQKWGGHVPLILLDAHESLAQYEKKSARAAYWKRPEVWKDLKAAFEKFFALNPAANGWRHNYARYAYWAEQWDELNRQLPLLSKINYEYFGGRDEYDKMVRLAKEHAGK